MTTEHHLDEWDELLQAASGWHMAVDEMCSTKQEHDQNLKDALKRLEVAAVQYAFTHGTAQ